MIKKIIKYWKYFIIFINIKLDLIKLINTEQQKLLLKIEQFIINENNKRKKLLNNTNLAKELLLYNDYYIIDKDNLKNFITKEGNL